MSDDTRPGGFQLHALQNVRPLRPIRVLLAGRDVRYLRVIAFLLGRLEYETRQVTRSALLAAEVESFRADVVILDAGSSFAEAAAQAAALIATTDRLGVVLAVDREVPPDSARLHFVQKWARFTAVSAAVESAWAEIHSADARERSELESSREARS